MVRLVVGWTSGSDRGEMMMDITKDECRQAVARAWDIDDDGGDPYELVGAVFEVLGITVEGKRIDRYSFCS
jgi:hypothetical protein